MNNLLSENDKKAVMDILVEQLDVKPEQLTLDADIMHDLGADSLTKIEIVMALDERFGIAIPDEKTEEISTVGDILQMLGYILEKRTS